MPSETKMIGKFKLDDIYCGDSLNLMKDIPHATIDLIVTDPPFAIDFKAKRNNYRFYSFGDGMLIY